MGSHYCEKEEGTIMKWIIIVKKVVDFILEHCTLAITIVASAYIVIISQITPFSTEVLLLWIISLLGLIAAAIASEKYYKLNKIAKEIETLSQQSKTKKLTIDDLFSTRKELEPLEERLRDASEIVLTGGSLCRLADEYYAFFEEKLSKGCSIEIIMVRPNTHSANLLCDNVVYETQDYSVYSQKIQNALDAFKTLKENYPSQVIIRLSDKVPPYGMIAADLRTENAKIKIELYTYSVSTRERIQLNITKNDKKMFEFFLAQLEVLRNASPEIND